jgi:capsular exopolysaccharide synthesis family protein
MAEREQIVQKSDVENLYLIPGGPMPPNPSELLLRPQMDTLMKELKSQFDFIIIDTPPLAYVADAFILSQYSDHTLFVVRQDYTPKAALQTLEELFTTGKLNNVSILFNDLRKSGFGYGYGPGYNYGYGYNYYYGYGKKKQDSSNGYYTE